MPPKVPDEHKIARREEILDAALLCFSRDGLDRATLRDIGAESGLSLGTLYHYFPTKAELIAGLRARDLSREEEELWGNAPAPTSKAWTEHVLRFNAARMDDPRSEDANRVAVMLWAQTLLDGSAREAQVAAIQRPLEAMVQVVRVQQEEGLVAPSLDAETVFFVWLGSHMGFQILKSWLPNLRAADYAEVIGSMLTGGYWTGPTENDG